MKEHDWTEGEITGTNDDVPYGGNDLGELADALWAAQKEMEDLSKDEKNPFYKSQYLSLHKLLKHVRGIYNKYGITFIQEPISNGNWVGCKTILLHKDGTRMEFGPLMFSCPEGRPQEGGSAVSYARRYSALAVAGLAAEDDDAEGATTRGRGTEHAPITPPLSTVGPSDGEATVTVYSIGRSSDRSPFKIDTSQGEFTTWDTKVVEQAELAKTAGAMLKFKWKKNANPKFKDRVIVWEEEKK